jgi:DNA-binding beta-propeller fold protein YncE
MRFTVTILLAAVMTVSAQVPATAGEEAFPSVFLDSIYTGRGVYCLDCPPPGDRLYVGVSHELLVYSVPGGYPVDSLGFPECVSGGICSTPDGNVLALGFCSPTPALSILALPGLDEIALFSLEATPDAACSSPSGDVLYAVCGEDSTLWAFDIEGPGTAATARCAGEPAAICTSPSGDMIYVALASPADLIQVFSAHPVPAESDRWTAGGNPGGICVSPDGSLLYVTLTGDETVISVDTSDGTVVDSVVVGSIPVDIAILPSGDYLYTANGLGCGGTIVRALDMAVAGSIRSGFRGGVVCVSPEGSLVFAASAQDGYVFVTGN